MSALVTVVVAMAMLAAYGGCVGGEATSPPEAPTTTTTAAPGTGGAPTTPGLTAPTRAGPDDGACPAPAPLPAGTPSVELADLGAHDGIRVGAAVYPRPRSEGRPWTQWGQGAVLPDGRFVSAMGDHLGVDGNAWFFELDPATGVLARVADVQSAVGHRAGDWGYGKVHAALVVDGCGPVYAATYWGSRAGLRYGGSYDGDQLLAYDPATHRLRGLGTTVESRGVPSLAGGGGFLFGEAVDPFAEPDSGDFFAYDIAAGTVSVIAEERHVGFRSIAVDGDGRAYFSAGGARLWRYDADGGGLELLEARLPGRWMRAATAPAADGTVFGVTREPDRLFALRPSGAIDDLGPVEGYVASIALAPGGEQVLYVPGAHGDAWNDGTPLVSVDIRTGEHEVLLRLDDVVAPELGVHLLGSYDVAVDAARRRVFVGSNAGDPATDEWTDVVLVTLELP